MGIVIVTRCNYNDYFHLHRRLLERIDQATAIEATIFEQFGETEETIPELEQLQNIRKRAISSYTRLNQQLRLLR